MVLAGVLVVVLSLAALAFIARPMVRGHRVIRRDEERRSVTEEKRVALQLLRDLEHDRQTGLLDEEDYSRQRSDTERRAIAAMRRLDDLGMPETGDRAEALIREERTRLDRESGR